MPIPWANGSTIDAASLNGPGILAVHNSDSITLNAGDPVSIYLSYTSGLGVKASAIVSDPLCIGTIVGTAIPSGGSGYVLAPGFFITNVNVTGTVVFGHALIPSGTQHYAQDGGALFPVGMGGILGWALAAQASGTGTISMLARNNIPTEPQLILPPQIATGVASVTFSGIPATPFPHLMIRGYNLYTMTAGSDLYVQFNGDTGNNYYWGNTFTYNMVTGAGAGGNAVAFIQLSAAAHGLSYGTYGSASLEIKIMNAFYSPARDPIVSYVLTATSPGASDNNVYQSVGGGFWIGHAAITSIKIYTSSANNMWGEFDLFGLYY